MGKDNQPKIRQAKELARKVGRRASYDRILIVSEGSKTEPLYFSEIRSEYRLNTANIQVQHSQFGTTPLQVVNYAEHLLLNGDAIKEINPRTFEQVFAVFDRDSHPTYHNALDKAAALDKKYRNDLSQPVQFAAVASVPCFELWLLLHFQNVLAPMHRNLVYQYLRQYLPNYNKGEAGHYLDTCHLLTDAIQRAEHLSTLSTAHNSVEPYTDMHILVQLLTTLKTEKL